MSVLDITTVGHPLLRARAPEVSLEDLRSLEFQRLVDDLIETRRGARGAGLAANQVSVPGLRGDVERLARIRAQYVDRHGAASELVVEGLSAGTFQHEVDHLDGLLFLDRVTDPSTFSTWEQFERHHQEAFLQRVAAYARGGAEA